MRPYQKYHEFLKAPRGKASEGPDGIEGPTLPELTHQIHVDLLRQLVPI